MPLNTFVYLFINKTCEFNNKLLFYVIFYYNIYQKTGYPYILLSLYIRYYRKRMKHILIFNDTLQYGGTETMLINVLKYLSKKEYKLTLLLPYPSSADILLNEVPDNIYIKYIYKEKPIGKKKILFENLASFFPRIHNRMINLNLNQYDLIISFKDSIYSILFSKSKVRKILWIHNLPTKYKYGINNIREYIPVKLLQKRISRLINSYLKFDDVIFVSNISKQRYIDIFNNGKQPKQNLIVLHNAIEKNKIAKLANENIEIDNNEYPLFIMVTRFSVEKRVDRVIKAAARLKAEGYKLHIIILGDGTLKSQIDELIKDYSLQESISLLGYVSNPYPYIKKSDWLVSSSEKESFSLVILESMFLGTPVITTDCGGPTEITENGKYALLTPNSTDGIYSAMKQVLDFPQTSDLFTSKTDDYLKKFDYDNWLKSVKKIIEKA